MNNDIQVSIVCNTYNHQKYISEALDSFVQQKTSFPFEVLIHDDASTDGTPDIIRLYERDYPELIKPIYQKENQYSQHININKTYQVSRAKGKYIAVCEGDDYWIDKFKIQKQYDELEMHNDISMCAHAAIMLIGEKERDFAPCNKKTILSCDEVISNGGGYLATNSLFYRRKMWDKIPLFYQFLPLDYSLQIWGALNAGILFLPDKMSVYRAFVPNSWTSRMNINTEERKRHIKRINEMLKILDSETQGKFSESINTHIAENGINLLEIENRYSDIRHGEYKEYYKRLPFKRKTKIIAKQALQTLGISQPKS